MRLIVSARLCNHEKQLDPVYTNPGHISVDMMNFRNQTGVSFSKYIQHFVLYKPVTEVSLPGGWTFDVEYLQAGNASDTNHSDVGLLIYRGVAPQFPLVF